MSTHPLLALALAGLGTATLTLQAAEIEVMTQNQYLGADLIALVAEPDFDQAVIDALKVRAASLPTERVAALARLIERRMPALVGLEEVYRFTCVDGNPYDDLGCQNQAIAGAFTDQLDDTLAALGGRYRAAAKVIDLDLPADLPALAGLPGIPVWYDEQYIFVGVTDRDVILARPDVATTTTPFQAFCARPSGDGCRYQFVASATLVVAGQPAEVSFERGLVGVDATVAGKTYRFVATHLETRLEGLGETARYYQSAQAYELLQLLAGLQLAMPLDKVLLVGDFNSDPARDGVIAAPPGLPYLGVPPHMQITAAGFTDVWTLRPGVSSARSGPLAGLSCCQEADLGNARSVLYERVDLIFSSALPSRVQDARLLGESVSDKTPPVRTGVWPSDHASVAAKLTFR